jgi:tripartite-type tricarboxylate transporter receptor subunit TctC
MKPAFLLAAVLAATAASAQTYPVKPIRVITAEPGGGNDFTTRIIGQAIASQLGQPWVIDNRGGAGGVIAIETAARAPSDGYTLLVYAQNVWTIPLLRKGVHYEVKDFAPITWIARSPCTLVVHPSLPVHSVQDLIALARARPGQLSYGTGGVGTITHLSAELFKSMAKVDILFVPYKGNGPAMNDLIAGQVQMMFGTAGTVAPHVRSGRVRAIAVTSAEPSPLAPGLPTFAASGLPGYESISMYGMYAPAKTPETIIRHLNSAVVSVLNMPDVRGRFFNSGMEVVASTPEQFAAAIKTDEARLRKVIKDAGIRAE